MSNEVLHTKYGNARLDAHGYYRITSRKEGNSLKWLHKLIYEDYHKVTILPKNVVHHLDGNPLNNNINNLALMTVEEHNKLHHSNKSIPFDAKLKLSESRNTSGYFRVVKEKCPRCKNGFYYKYKYYANGKRKALCSVDLTKLKKKVIANGLIWKKLEGDWAWIQKKK